MTILLFILGLTLLIIGAEILVRGASKIAAGLGISPLIIGLTVVAFGTSSPELAVSIKSSIAGQADIALGNVLGSNIFNILFILGLSSIIAPLFVSKQLIRFDLPIMILLSVGVLLISLDRLIGGFDGWILIIGLTCYIGTLAYFSLRKKNQIDLTESGDEPEEVKWGLNIIYLFAGLAMLIFGSRWFVNSAVTFAEKIGISELIIGLTIVAAGTSMPEVVTSIIAALRGERDIAVGNIVGSNIFNILAVLGISSVLAPAGLPVSEAAIGLEIPLLIAVSVACLPIFFTGGTINRWEGALFLGYYIAYTLYLILNAAQHDLLPAFNYVMFYFVVPITVITIGVIFFQEFKKPTDQASP
ncbi:MAG: calcium/sodium antiporter [Balneolaceae bacterium]|nr:calcium/sodium antiporter [Balneolaceae bacterium]MDR9408425.1 calcium/sodium antiporter [Balneolaceae bacterium]